jgi:hypothetical protein
VEMLAMPEPVASRGHLVKEIRKGPLVHRRCL